MPINPKQHDVDLSRCAAYVVGRNPHTLCMCLDRRREDAPVGGRVRIDQSQDHRSRVEELRKAIRILAVAGRVHTAVQVELHRELDRWERVFSDAGRAAEPIDEESHSASSTDEEPDLVRLAARVVSGPEDLLLLARLGSLMGRALRRLAAATGFEEFRPEELRGMSDLAERLCVLRGNAVLRRALQDAQKVLQPAAPGSRKLTFQVVARRYRELEGLDGRLRCGLSREEAPEPLMTLSRERLVLFGEAEELVEGDKENQIGCLWVLAESAGRPVLMATIVKEANIIVNSTANSLKSIVSRLRSQIMRPLIQRYQDNNPGSGPVADKDALIRGRVKGANIRQFGAYMLDLPASRVRVCGPRPRWMRQASL